MRRNRHGDKSRWVSSLSLTASGLVLIAGTAVGQDAPVPDPDQSDSDYSLHGQFTNVTQFHPAFTSPYRGANSLDPGNRGDETIDLTLFAGVRLWDGGAVYANPEIDQGFGLSNTLGAAGFPSAEAYKIGAADPYVRLPRAFLRQTFDLGGESAPVEDDVNQVAGARAADNLVLTIGKFGVTDIFDTNTYAHDPRADFLNWSVVDAGAFDYAADSWGYSYGVAGEWTQDWWTLRAGLFDLSRVPNDKALQRGFEQFEADIEGEERHTLGNQPGKLKVLIFMNEGRMANYGDATRLGAETGTTPDVALVRRDQARLGGSLNLEQAITGDLGAFARFSLNDGTKEAYEFTEINQSLALGLSLKGASWSRPDDVVGLAGVVNELSPEAREYLAAGGLGILIGDGRLPHYGTENIIETYYKVAVIAHVSFTADYQFIDNPAYNRDRGPVSVFGARVHVEY
jgi:high affinity Mn2+ porin